MRFSRSLFNFALIFCVLAFAGGFYSCKGRTMENMEPNGDTIEVVIIQDTISNTSNTNL